LAGGYILHGHIHPLAKEILHGECVVLAGLEEADSELRGLRHVIESGKVGYRRSVTFYQCFCVLFIIDMRFNVAKRKK